MSDSNKIRVRDFYNAQDFIDYLNPNRGPWGENRIGDWVFRGQANSDWRLQPSAWRVRGDGFSNLKPLIDIVERDPIDDKTLLMLMQSRWKPNGMPSIADVAKQLGSDVTDEKSFLERIQKHSKLILAEWDAVRRFALLANKIGLPVHGMIDMLDRVPVFKPYWPHLDLNRTFALAQHHGVPTRLLDWSLNPWKAAFFAASESLDASVNSIAVWALKISELRLSRKIKQLHCPRSDFHYLHCQEGLFLAPTGIADEFFIQHGHWPCLDEWILDANFLKRSITLEKITLSRSCCEDLLSALSRYSIVRAQLMPTYDNVVATLRATKWEYC